VSRRAGSLSVSEARRIALGAQGFAGGRPCAPPDRRHVRKVIAHVGAIQVDSVNVVARSQELALWSRLGPHRRDLLPSLIAGRELFEYWGHEASLLPVEHHHLFRFKMATAHQWGGLGMTGREAELDAVLAAVRAHGPLTAGELAVELAVERPRRGPWWGWDDTKRALEYLFWQGRLTARRRPNTFERDYDLPERVLPPGVLGRPTPEPDDARRALLELAARHHGVGTAGDLADYYRLRLPVARPLLADLVDEGRLVPVRVEGWKEPAYLHPGARVPRRVSASAVLSPFDSLVWERRRTERLFGFTYRLEIYTPSHRRVHGYYVLPFLLGEDLVARVDLKADRKAGCLLVHGAFAEPGHDRAAVAAALAGELTGMARWLGLDEVRVGRLGDLSARVRTELRRPAPPG